MLLSIPQRMDLFIFLVKSPIDNSFQSSFKVLQFLTMVFKHCLCDLTLFLFNMFLQSIYWLPQLNFNLIFLRLLLSIPLSLLLLLFHPQPVAFSNCLFKLLLQLHHIKLVLGIGLSQGLVFMAFLINKLLFKTLDFLMKLIKHWLLLHLLF